MNVAIIDADLVGRKQHRFPNLVCMKLSGYYKSKGHTVTLKLNYENLEKYDLVFISKVFTDTPIDEKILSFSNVRYGGTGFFFDKAPDLPYEIEHFMPDYDLYSSWVQDEIQKGVKESKLVDYLKSSIGFTTRGCFRKCEFCVNKKYDCAFIHSPIDEFLDTTKPRISLWDDNFLAYPKWREILQSLIDTKKYFQFRQGLDLRLMTEEKVLAFKPVKYFGDYIFAFDFIEDREIIEEKLKLWKKHIKKTTKLYVFCGFDRSNKYDDEFWKQDIIDTFERIKILMRYGCLPYIMRHENYEKSPYRGIYITLARWCNQPSYFKKESLAEYVYITDSIGREDKQHASKTYLETFQKDFPEIAAEYYHIKFESLNQYTTIK